MGSWQIAICEFEAGSQGEKNNSLPANVRHDLAGWQKQEFANLLSRLDFTLLNALHQSLSLRAAFLVRSFPGRAGESLAARNLAGDAVSAGL